MNLVERVTARYVKKIAVDLPDWLFGAEGHKLIQEAVKAVEHAIKSKCGVSLAPYAATHVTETEHILWGFDETHGGGGKTIHGRFLLSLNAVLTDLSVEVSYVPWDPKAGRLDHSAIESESHGNVDEKGLVHAAGSLAEKVCSKVHASMKANAEAAMKGKGRKREADTYHVAALFLEQKLAEQGKAAPKKVDDLFKEVKDGNPGYSEEQAWATAWSIYCKHVDPNGEHCHKGPGGYLKEASDPAHVRQLLSKSIKHMKDITGPNWEGFAEKHAELAKATVHMAAQDAIRAMEEAEQLLATSKQAAAVREGDKVEVTKGKEKGLTGIVKHLKAGPHGNQLAVDLDHPVHKMMGPAIIDPGSVKKVGAVTAEEHVNLTPKEIARKDNTGHTVVVRPQSGGGYMVAVVEIQGDKGRLMGKPYTEYVKTQGEIAKATKEVVRWLQKLGHPSEMSDKSRHRHAEEASIERPTPSAEEANIQRPTPMAGDADAPEESGWAPYEKHGEWNLLIYHPGGRRNLHYFMKNPQGGGGGSNDGTSVKGLVNMVIHQTGWATPHINPHKKDKVWVSVLQFDGNDWKPMKQWWEPVPKELLVPKEPKQLTHQEFYEGISR